MQCQNFHKIWRVLGCEESSWGYDEGTGWGYEGRLWLRLRGYEGSNWGLEVMRRELVKVMRIWRGIWLRLWGYKERFRLKLWGYEERSDWKLWKYEADFGWGYKVMRRNLIQVVRLWGEICLRLWSYEERSSWGRNLDKVMRLWGVI